MLHFIRVCIDIRRIGTVSTIAEGLSAREIVETVWLIILFASLPSSGSETSMALQL